VQYRGAILPLVDVGLSLGGQATLDPQSPFVSVVVYSEGKRSAGLVVGEILDIVESRLDIALMNEEGQNAILGCAVVEGKITDLVDVRTVLTRAGEGWGTLSAWETLDPELPPGEDPSSSLSVSRGAT